MRLGHMKVDRWCIKKSQHRVDIAVLGRSVHRRPLIMVLPIDADSGVLHKDSDGGRLSVLTRPVQRCESPCVSRIQIDTPDCEQHLETLNISATNSEVDRTESFGIHKRTF
jgi:hypothetical protein